MRLFKSSGDTYRRVTAIQQHAFNGLPQDRQRGELVLLSKNREDCGVGERQIQYLAKYVDARPAQGAELETLFPGVGAGNRWNTVVRLHWSQRLREPFNLSTILGPKAERYDTVQSFARVDAEDELAIVRWLSRHNSEIVLSFLNSPAVDT